MNETRTNSVKLGDVGWRQLTEHRLKSRVMLWHSLTANLLQLALGENSRYTVEYVIQLITQKFGRWLNPLEGPAKKHLHASLRSLAEDVIKLDWYVPLETARGVSRGFVDSCQAERGERLC
jgi:hypothetical protein